MRYFLFVCALVTLFWSTFTFSAATTALHEIQASIIFMTSALLLTGAAITDVVVDLQKNINGKD
jgi:hypothetical protein